MDLHDSKLITLRSDEVVAKGSRYRSNYFKTYTKPEKQLKGQNNGLNNDVLRLTIDQ